MPFRRLVLLVAALAVAACTGSPARTVAPKASVAPAATGSAATPAAAALTGLVTAPATFQADASIVGQGGGNFVGHNGSAIVGQGGGNATDAGGNFVGHNGSAIVAKAGGNAGDSGGNYRLQTLTEAPLANTTVYLADAAGVPLAGVPAQKTDANGAYAFPKVPTAQTFVVIALAKSPQGAVTLCTLARAVDGQAASPIGTASTVVTVVVVAGNTGTPGDFDPGSFRDAVARAGTGLGDQSLPDLTSLSAIAAFIKAQEARDQVFAQKLDELSRTLAHIAAQVDKIATTVSEVDTKVDEILKILTSPSPTATAAATATATPATPTPPPAPLPTPNVAGLGARHLMVADGAGGVWLDATEGYAHLDEQGALKEVWKTPGAGLARDAKGALWTAEGAELVRRQADATLTRSEDLARLAANAKAPAVGTPNAVAVATDGAVWLGSEMGIFRYDPAKASAIANPTTTAVKLLAASADGQVWGARTDKVGLYRTDTLRANANEDLEPASWLTSSALGRAWVVTSTGVAKLKPDASTGATVKDSLGYRAIALDAQDQAWCVDPTKHQVVAFDGNGNAVGTPYAFAGDFGGIAETPAGRVVLYAGGRLAVINP